MSIRFVCMVVGGLFLWGCQGSAGSGPTCTKHDECGSGLCIEGLCVELDGLDAESSMMAQLDSGSQQSTGGGGGSVLDSSPSSEDAARSDDDVSVRDAQARTVDMGVALDQGALPQDMSAASLDEGPVDFAIAECVPGARRCEPGSSLFELLCDEDGQWDARPCNPGERCLQADEGCQAEPDECLQGSLRCVAGGQIERCIDGDWRFFAVCGAGQICQEGRCIIQSCAQAELDRSHLGCDFLAVDLPNSAFDSRDVNRDGSPDGTTPDSPIGVLVVNPSEDRAVQVSIRGPDGRFAPLVGNQRVAPPNIPQVEEVYEPITVGSRVQDANGAEVAGQVDMANRREIPPGGVGTFLLPRRMAPLGESSLRGDAYRVQTNHPVAVSQFSPYCCNFSFSNDASLLLPTSALSARYGFLGIPTHIPVNQFGNEGSRSPGIMAVVSPTDDNEVEVQLRDGQTISPDPNARVVVRDDVIRVTMAAQDVLIIASSLEDGADMDLSGALVTAQAPVSVFSAHICTYYPASNAACDHTQEQLLPLESWGNEYLLVPPKERGENVASEVTYWKLLGSEQETRIQLSVPFADLEAFAPGMMGVTNCADLIDPVARDTIVLRPGQFCEFGTKSSVRALANHPIMVIGIIVGQEATYLPGLSPPNPFGQHAGDPAVFLMPPVRQYRSNYQFVSPETYFGNYVTIISPAANDLVLDGQPIDPDGANPILGSDFRYHHVELEDGAHRISGRTPFSVLVYAYDDFVSYAFPGGLNLSR